MAEELVLGGVTGSGGGEGVGAAAKASRIRSFSSKWLFPPFPHFAKAASRQAGGRRRRRKAPFLSHLRNIYSAIKHPPSDAIVRFGALKMSNPRILFC